MGAGEIDSLEIKIQANAQKANQSLDALVGKLERLSTSLGKVNGNSLASLSNGVQRLSSSMQSMKNIGTADFTRLAKNIQKMGQLDSKQLGKAAGSIHKFVNTLGTIDKINVSDNAAQIGQLAKGISQLGYKSSTQAIENIPKLAKAMRQLMTELSKAPRVSQNLIQMTNALAKLSRTGASSGRAAESLSRSFTTLSNTSFRTSKNLIQMPNIFKGIFRSILPLLGIRQLFNWGKEAVGISSSVTEVQNVVDTTFGDMSYKVDDFAKTAKEKFGMSELSVKTFASQFQAMGTAMGISSKSIEKANEFLNKQTKGYVGLSDSMADVSINLTKLAGDLASFYDISQEDAAEKLQSIFTGQTRPLRSFGIDLTQATLQEWALKNGIDANVQSMSQAEKTMLRYMYVLQRTGAAQGDFSKTIYSWHNQLTLLKENFKDLGKVVGGTLISAFKPLVIALNSVMGNLIAFAETVSNALGKIFGWKFEKGSGGAGTAGLATDMEDAADSAGGLADNTGKAAKNIDKMKAGLRAFDELKTISMPDSGSGSGSGSGGSGGSGSGASSGSGGQWTKQDSIFEDYKSSIDSLKGLGEYIGGALIDAMDGIPWDSIYQKADQFGSGLASFLNGLFEGKNGETLLGCVGTTIAGTLNTVLHGLDSFGKTFSWEQFGVNLSQGLNNFFATFDFDLLADTINTWAHGILTTCITFVKTTDWKQIGTKIGEFLAKLDFSGIADQLGTLLWSSINAAIDTWKSMFDAAPIETTILTAIGILKFTGLGTLLLGKMKDAIVIALGAEKGTSIGMALLGWIGRGISSIATNIGLVIEGLFNGMKFSEALASVFGGSSSAISALITTIGGVVSVVGGAITSIVSFVSMLKDGFSWVKEAIMGVGIALTAVGAVILGAPALVAAVVAGIVAAVATIVVVVKDNWETIKGWFSSAGEWFNTNVITPVSGFFSELCTSVSGFFSGLWEGIKEVWTTVSTWFNDTVITPVSDVFDGVCTRIGQFFEGCWLIVQAAWEIASTWFKDNVTTPIKTKFGEVKDKIKSAFTTAKDAVVKAWETVSGWVTTNVTDPIKTKFGEVKTKITTAFGDAKKAVVDKWKGVKKWFSDTVIDPVKGAFKTACDKIGGFFTSLWSGIKKGVATAFNAVLGSIESAINGIVGGINKMLSGFNNVAKKAGEIVGKDYSGVAKLNTVSLPRIKGYEAGGFPDKYSLFMAGEHGIPEIAGTVGGKTAVAGGAEITGIRDAIYTSSQQEMRLLQEQNQLLRGILNKQFGITKNEIGRSARDYAREQYIRTGENAFVF